MEKGILYFTAPWCEPCKMLGPQMEQLSNEGFKIKKINIDYDAELPQHYNVKSIPCSIITDLAGKELKRHVGTFDGLTAIKKWFNG